VDFPWAWNLNKKEKTKKFLNNRENYISPSFSLFRVLITEYSSALWVFFRKGSNNCVYGVLSSNFCRQHWGDSKDKKVS